MKAFGLELRRPGNVAGLYKDVDRVLANAGIIRDGVGGHVQQQTVAHVLQNMITKKHYFDVCAVKECAELCQVIINAERMLVYRSIHCMDWDQMMPEYRQTIVAMLLDDFRTVLTPNAEELVCR